MAGAGDNGDEQEDQGGGAMMVKRKCEKCGHIFALEANHKNKTAICPKCYGPTKKL